MDIKPATADTPDQDPQKHTEVYNNTTASGTDIHAPQKGSEASESDYKAFNIWFDGKGEKKIKGYLDVETAKKDASDMLVAQPALHQIITTEKLGVTQQSTSVDFTQVR